MSEGDPEIPNMKILTWNVNGIRSLYKDAHAVKAGLDALDADIICFQETKTASMSDHCKNMLALYYVLYI